MLVKKTEFLERYKKSFLHLLDTIAKELNEEEYEYEMIERMDNGIKEHFARLECKNEG